MFSLASTTNPWTTNSPGSEMVRPPSALKATRRKPAAAASADRAMTLLARRGVMYGISLACTGENVHTSPKTAASSTARSSPIHPGTSRPGLHAVRCATAEAISASTRMDSSTPVSTCPSGETSFREPLSPSLPRRQAVKRWPVSRPPVFRGEADCAASFAGCADQLPRTGNSEPQQRFQPDPPGGWPDLREAGQSRPGRAVPGTARPRRVSRITGDQRLAT